MFKQRLVFQHPLVGRRTHGEGADIGEEGLERTAVTARIRFEQPVETVLGIGDVAVDARRRVVLRFRHDRHHVSPVRQVHAPDRLDPLSRSCRRSCAPTTSEASGPGAGECGRGGETLAEPAGCRSPKAQVRRTGSSSGRDQRTSAQRGGSRSRSLPVAVRVTAQLSWRERAQSGIVLPDMATYRTASVLLSSDGTRTPGTAALFAEPARKGGTPPWAGDFRPANSAGNGPKNAVGKTFTLA